MRVPVVVVFLAVCLLAGSPVAAFQGAAQGEGPAAAKPATPPANGRVFNEAEGETEPAVYIIQLADPPVTTYRGGIPGLAATSPAVTGERKLNAQNARSRAYERYLEGRQNRLLADIRRVLNRSANVRFAYRHAYNGLALRLSPAEAAAVAQLEGVSLLFREQEDHILTDAGPAFIGAPSLWAGAFTEQAYVASLDGSQEVPPSGSAATGTGSFTYDLKTRELTWDISHNVAGVTAAHIHRAPAGVNGPVEISLDHTVNPMAGSATLTEDQQGYLVNRQLYVNIHTPEFPEGEIRGQIEPTGTMGEGIIVGVIDTGINPGHPSFAPVAGDGYVHTNPYGSGNFVGYCVANPSFCNDKLIGAWALHPSSTNPTDTDGHGSHTASTAAGNVVADPVLHAPTATFDFDFVSGVAPRANIIAYQVCVPSCPTSSTTAAVNQAVIDGVDVLNYSISGGSSPWVETTAVAFRNAVAAGVLPANSAGNSGPGPATVGHQGPWIMTVAASTHDRAVLNSVVDLTSTNGPFDDILGESAATGYGPESLIYAGDAPYDNPLCNPFTGTPFSGQIVVCDRGVIGRVAKGANVLAAGGGGMILLNDAPSGASLNADTHVLPATHIGYSDGVALKAWMASGADHSGRITGGSVDYGDYGDNMASFSSRGPAGAAVPGLADLIKPDISAPGLNILAAYHAGFSTAPEFNIISGTSMSSPHAAGAAALVRAVHPSWTPSEVKSALMMSGITSLNKEDGTTAGDPFDFGAGRVDLTAASRVGFVLDVTDADYAAANPATGGDPKTLNLASFANASCMVNCSWTRTLRSVVDSAQEYSVSLSTPAGVGGNVSPSSFTIPAGGTQTITLTIDVSGVAEDEWHFADVAFTAVGNSAIAGVHMPVAVKGTAAPDPEPTIDVDPDSLSATQAADTTTNQTLTISNFGGAVLEWSISQSLAVVVQLSQDADHGPAPDVSALSQIASAVAGPTQVPLNDALPQSTGQVIDFVLDDGTRESAVGLTGGAQFLWLNRFTPSQALFPIKLEKIEVYFGADLGLAIGEEVDLYVYQDADGNPANGADFVGSLTDQQIQLFDDFSAYTVDLTLTGPGDVLIAVVNRTAGITPSTFPAAIDQSSSHQRSWVGFGEVPGDPPTLPMPTFGLIDNLGIAGNWMVRGQGSSEVCADVTDVPWLDVDPASGSTAPAGSDEVTVTFDSTGLAAGTHEAALCITSNDPVTPLVVVPVTLEVVDIPAIEVSPDALSVSLAEGAATNETLTISNVGEGTLAWTIHEAEAPATAPAGDGPDLSSPAGVDRATGFEGEVTPMPAIVEPAPQALVVDSLNEGFDDISQLPGAGWAMINRSDPLGSTGWFQGNPSAFHAHEGATNSYIAANFHNGAGVATISNWLITPEVTLADGDQVSFWTRRAASEFVDRLQLRMSLAGDSTDVGTTATSVGDFTTLLIDINPSYAADGYPIVWTQYNITLSGIGSPTSGRLAFRYFVENGGPSGSRSDYIGIDTFSYQSSDACATPTDIGWLDVGPTSGSTPAGEADEVTVGFDSSGLAPGTYHAQLCIDSNDPSTPRVHVPVTLEVSATALYEQLVNAGGGTYVDGDDNVWSADQKYVAGAWGYTGNGPARTTHRAILGTEDQALFQSLRQNPVEYRFDGLAAGDYEVRLLFADIGNTRVGNRIFDVIVENTVVLPALDIAALVGVRTAFEHVEVVTVTDGQLNIRLVRDRGQPIINAIAVRQLP